MRTDATNIEVFARGSDGNIYRRPYDGNNWSNWAPLLGLGETTDARSDLDCSAAGATVHIVATGLKPVGALLHAFGVGTAYNRFTRELETSVFDPSPSITVWPNMSYSIGAVASLSPVLAQYPATPEILTPVTTAADSLLSGPDIAQQAFPSSSTTYFVAFDSDGALALYYWVINSGGFHWAEPIKLSAPAGTFAFSPTICTENNEYGVYSVNIAAVAGGKLWYRRSDSVPSFSSWIEIGENIASSPDCVVGGPDSIVNVVALSPAGTVINVRGKATSWVASDLGSPR